MSLLLRLRLRVKRRRVESGAVGEHRLDLMLLRLADIATAAKAALGGGALRAQVVAQVRLLALDLPLGRQLEALFGAAVRLHLDFRHIERRSISIGRALSRETSPGSLTFGPCRRRSAAQPRAASPWRRPGLP